MGLKILVFAPNPWNGPWLNRQQLFSRIGTRHEVLYSQGLRWGTQALRPLSAGLSARRDGVLVDTTPSWTFRSRWALADAAAVRVAARRWRRLLGSADGDFVAYVCHPKFEPYLDPLRPRAIVYHAYDFFHRQASWTAEYDAAEKRLVARADACVASSAAIARRLESLGARDPLLLENGAEYRLFADASVTGEVPADIRHIPHPRIGYTGALSRKVDFPLVRDLAQRRRDWQFVLIGRIGNLDDVTEPAVRTLRTLGNVHFLEHKPHASIPAYVAAMDVNVMWYRVGPDLWTEGGYPLKLHEYLAAGQPVIGTGLESVKQYGQVVTIPQPDADSWESAIDDALKNDTPAQRLARQAVARGNDWGARAAELEALLIRIWKSAA